MKLFARKKKGKKLLDEEEEENEFKHLSPKKQSPKSILRIKDENSTTLSSRKVGKQSKSGGFDGASFVENATSSTASGSGFAPDQPNGNSTFSTAASPEPTFSDNTKEPMPQASSPQSERTRTMDQDLFPVRKLRRDKNGSSSSYNSDASSTVTGNHENTSPSFEFNRQVEQVTLLKNLGKLHFEVSQHKAPSRSPPLKQGKSTPRSGRELQKKKRSDQEQLQFVRTALTRPFGREYLPPSAIVSESAFVFIGAPFFTFRFLLSFFKNHTNTIVIDVLCLLSGLGRQSR